MVVKSATYEAMTCKRTYVSPSLEVITEEEEPWIVCASVKVEGGDQTGTDAGNNDVIPSKYNPFSSSMFSDDDFDNDFENEDY